jgi:1-deoxyxylulose-5-phosphate synthase
MGAHSSSALDLGVNFFDTANNYSDGESEAVLGRRCVTLRIATRSFSRRRFARLCGRAPTVAVCLERHCPKIDKSLQRLCTDYIDLYRIHLFDHETPIEETLSTLNDLVRSGKVRYLGASNLHAWQLMKAIGLQRANGWAAFVSIQNHCSLLNREAEREMLPLCLSEGVGAIPWSPLARGRLTRPWSDAPATTRAESDNYAKSLFADTSAIDKPVVDRLHEVAHKRRLPSSQIALAWMLNNKAITAPIIGATKMEHLDGAVASLSVPLSKDEIDHLEEL